MSAVFVVVERDGFGLLRGVGGVGVERNRRGGRFGPTARSTLEALAALHEGAALLVSTRRPYAFAALAGGLIGTVGFAGEYAWSHLWMRIAWPETLIADALPARGELGERVRGLVDAGNLRLVTGFKVARLTEQGRMRPAGQAEVDG